MSKVKDASVLCSGCGGQIEIDPAQKTVECPYCGTHYSVADLLGESDAVRIEKIRSETKLKQARMRYAAQEERNQKENLKTFKRSKLSILLLIFAVISLLMCAVGFSTGMLLTGLIALAQTVLFSLAWLMGMQYLRERRKNQRALITLIACLLLVPFMFSTTCAPISCAPWDMLMEQAEEFTWEDLALHEKIPAPASDLGVIYLDSRTELDLNVYRITGDQFNDFIDGCRAKGFTVDAKESDSSFLAYDTEGYRLDVYYFDSDSELSIHLSAPMQMSELRWPVIGIGSQLPVPTSTRGSISSESETSFSVYVGDTDLQAYGDYVDACILAGFDVDYSRNDDYFYADNAAGDSLSVQYEGNRIMHISIYNYND